MTSLIIGLLLWSGTHLAPGLVPGLKQAAVRRLGENGYKGVFTLLMVAAIYLVISGWKSAMPEIVYLPPTWGRHATALLVLIAFILFFAPYPPNNLKRLLRHPQLTGVAVWGIGHLLANGESRSIVLFGGMTIWAIAEILVINRRDGARERPEPVPAKNDFTLAGGGIVAYVVVVAAHQWLFGFPPFPM